MRTATGLAVEAIERAQDSLGTARDTGQVSQEVFDRVFDRLLAAKVDLVNAEPVWMATRRYSDRWVVTPRP